MNTRYRIRPVAILFAAVLLSVSLFATEAAPLDDRRPLQLDLQGQWIGNGIAFSPYRDGQEPNHAEPTDAQILEDLRLVAHYWHFIRLYDSSEVSARILKLIDRERLPLRVMLGAWLVGEKQVGDAEKNRTEIARAIHLATTYPQIVIAINAGNEAGVDWSDHRATPQTIAAWIRTIRAGVTQPVTCADDYNFWNKPESRTVAAAVDFITLHAYALWNGQPLENAIAWTNDQYDACVSFHRGIPVIIGETGWATNHDASRAGPGGEGPLMKADVSVEAQTAYLKQHYKWVAEKKVPALLFEAFDEKWKGGGASTPATMAEKHWGVFDSDRHAKASLESVLKDGLLDADR